MILKSSNIFDMTGQTPRILLWRYCKKHPTSYKIVCMPPYMDSLLWPLMKGYRNQQKNCGRARYKKADRCYQIPFQEFEYFYTHPVAGSVVVAMVHKRSKRQGPMRDKDPKKDGLEITYLQVCRCVSQIISFVCQNEITWIGTRCHNFQKNAYENTRKSWNPLSEGQVVSQTLLH